MPSAVWRLRAQLIHSHASELAVDAGPAGPASPRTIPWCTYAQADGWVRPYIHARLGSYVQSKLEGALCVLGELITHLLLPTPVLVFGGSVCPVLAPGFHRKCKSREKKNNKSDITSHRHAIFLLSGCKVFRWYRSHRPTFLHIENPS